MLTRFFCFIVSLTLFKLQTSVHADERKLDSELVRNGVTDDLDEYWHELSATFTDYARQQSQQISQRWDAAKVEANLADKVSKKCLSMIDHLIEKPIENEWSAKIIDSMSIFPNGMLSGSGIQLGDFDQCIGIVDSFQDEAFVGKYCLATVHLPRKELFRSIQINTTNPAWITKRFQQWHNNDNWFSLASGVCFPSICKPTEIRDMIRAYYTILKMVEFDVTYCQSMDEPMQYHWGIWIALFILSIPIFPIIIGTALDACNDPQSITRFRDKFFKCFSLITNTKILFRISGNEENRESKNQEEANNDQFQYIHGVRALSSFFIIFCHSFGLMPVPLKMKVSAYAHYPNDMKEIAKMFWSQPIFNGALIVQTFFTMSGMLLAYNALSSKLKIQFLPYVMLRWLRYTPPLIGTICLTLVMQLLGNGPLFHHDLIWPSVQPCYESWWQNLLYVNNFRNFEDQCSVQTWYLAAEMQLHIIAFPILLAYLRGSRITYFVSSILAALGVIIPLVIILMGLAPLSLFHSFIYTQYPISNITGKLLYFPPYMQFTSYFLGAIVGQTLLEKRTFNISSTLNRIYWLLAIIIVLVFPFWTYPLIQADNVMISNPSLLIALLYITYLTLWNLANAWLFYRCSSNPSNPLARFLSAKILQPFSRLSFSLYLVHVLTIWYNTHQTRTAISLANLNELNKLISISVIQSLGLAYLLYLTFEAPSVNLMKLFLKPKQQSAQSENHPSMGQPINETHNRSQEQVKKER